MNLTGFAFGIRVVKSFSIEDKLGAIIDEILYSDKSEFNEKMFTDLNENHNTKVLFNRNGDGNRFTITPRDFIFDYNIQNSFDSEFRKYLDSYIEVITKRVFKNFAIKNISRFGFIIKSSHDDKDPMLKEVSEVIKKYKGVDDSLSLRFNVVTKKPLKMNNDFVTEDYDNEIVTYNKQNAYSPLVFSVDYQKYFKPELNIIEDSTQDFATFCNNAFNAFKTTYLKSENNG